MTLKDPEECDGDVPCGQILTALHFLELCHGDALRRPWSDEALAYYRAISILEDALQEDLLPPDELERDGYERARIEQSREARQGRFSAATLPDRGLEEDTTQRTTLIGSIRDYLMSP